MADKKFSQFASGGNVRVGDIVVGLRSGTNYQFTFPSTGISDANGNELIGWLTAGAAAVNYLNFQNANASGPVIIESLGDDANVDITIQTQGTGSVHIPANVDQVTQLDVDNIRIDANTISSTSGNLNLTPTGNLFLDSFDWSGMTNGQLPIGNTGVGPVAATLTAGPGISISNAAGSITISGGGGGYSWTEVTGVSQNMDVNNGYVANNAGLVTLTLPATANIGDSVIVQGKGAGLFKIAQNAGQTIHFGSSDTTTGAGGSLTATNRYDSIELLCITTNTDWAVLTGPQGTFTVA